MLSLPSKQQYLYQFMGPYLIYPLNPLPGPETGAQWTGSFDPRIQEVWSATSLQMHVLCLFFPEPEPAPNLMTQVTITRVH